MALSLAVSHDAATGANPDSWHRRMRGRPFSVPELARRPRIIGDGLVDIQCRCRIPAAPVQSAGRRSRSAFRPRLMMLVDVGMIACALGACAGFNACRGDRR